MINLISLIDKNNKEYDKIYYKKELNLIINFKTNDTCNCIQFLTKEQTRSKAYPFMFIQCEAVLNRSLFLI